MRGFMLKLLLLIMLSLGSHSLFAQPEGFTAIQNAANENRYLFIFFYKDQSEKTLQMQKIFDQAMQKLHEQANFIKVKANDPSEKPLIDKFNLKRSPMPLVLVLAPNGCIVGGFPSVFTEQQLTDSFVSAGSASCLKALQDRKLVILCLQNGRTKNNESALEGVRDFKADPRFASATEIVVIDPSDTQEHKFLKQLSLDGQSPQAMTILISPPAEVVGKYEGPLTKAQLMADLQRATSGCCPEGCCPGGRCGPKK